MKNKVSLLVTGSVFCAMAAANLAYAAPDAGQAEALLKANKCTKCHAVDKEKTGPAFKKIAAKFKGKADAEATLVKFTTTGAKFKNADGTEEEHKSIKAKDDAEVKNLVQWILSQ